eukprot:TRINITY_DN79970_c0_g1_i1.p1 TRINITY_DN79970_c0_g1~~TRINITY_DN79970_c0_g1_i1.p1  ORF type:complete len:2493 (+),score=634.37 TRINITY_DN79970_c0_g1_i1:120-7598(+)
MSSYALLDSEKDVEAGRNPSLAGARLSSMGPSQSLAHLAESVQLSQEKVVRHRPGIPTPPLPKARPMVMLRWLLVSAGVFGLIYLVFFSMTAQMVVPLNSNTKISLNMANCDFTAVDSTLDPHGRRMTIQFWKFLGDGGYTQTGDLVRLTVRTRARVSMFRCLVTLYVPAKEPLPELMGTVGGADMSRVVFDVNPAQRVQLQLRQVAMESRVLSKHMNLTATHGNIHFKPTALPVGAKSSSISITGDLTSVLVSTPLSMALSLGGAAKDNSIISAVHVKGDANKYLLSSANNSAAQVFVSYKATKAAPSYFLSGDETLGPDKFQTIKGELQSKDVPFLVNQSVQEMEEVEKWMTEISHTSAPWVCKLRVHGPGLPQGRWQLLNSQAYLMLPLEAFTVLSAGTLRPAIREVSVQLLSVHGMWPPRKPDPKETEDMHSEEKNHDIHSHHGLLHLHQDGNELQWEVFTALQPFFKKVENVATIAWVPDNGHPMIYQKRGNIWDARPHNTMKKQSMMFLVALTLNFTASAVCASILMYFGRKRIAALTAFREDSVSTAASQRVSKTSGAGAHEWRVMATQVDLPSHAVLLRWRKRTGVQRATYLYIYAEAEADPSRRLEGHEVCIEKVKADGIGTMKENTVIMEFLFSILGTQGFGHEPTGKNLRYQHSYKFQLEAYNNEEMPVGQSQWSNEVVVMPAGGVFDFPLLVLKTFFPVPTSSLGYFLDHHASRHIDGKFPQHIVRLSDIRVNYHRNFRDFGECNSLFFLTAYMGEGKVSSEVLTRAGRCQTFDKTAAFTPPPLVVKSDNDLTFAEEQQLEKTEGRQQILDTEYFEASGDGPQVLRIGSVDRENKDIIVSLRWESNEEDVAEAKIDFMDLMEAFEEVDRDVAEEDGTYFFDLVVENKLEFDEEYLVWIRAKVDFENNIDPLCEALPKEQRFFQKDAPGQIFYQGMERFVSWDSGSELLSSTSKFDLYVIYPDNPECEARLLQTEVSLDSGGLTFMVDMPPSLGGCYVVCQLELRANDDAIKIVSHRFMVCMTWTLPDFELAYASFCRMNHMQMQYLSMESLSTFSVRTAKVQLKVLPDLRPPLPFEDDVNMGTEIIHCPGHLMIGAETIATTTQAALDALQPDGDTAERLSDGTGATPGARKPETSQGSVTGSANSGTKREGGKGFDGPTVYRSTSQRVEIMEHIWPRVTVTNGWRRKRWQPSFLLLYGFYPVDNILDFMSFMVDFFRLRIWFDALQAMLGSWAFDKLTSAFLLPITMALPFVVEAVLFALQLSVFMFFPLVLVLGSLAYEFLSSTFDETLEMVSDPSLDRPHLPDIVFGRDVSGRDWISWYGDLSLCSRAALVAGSFSVVLQSLLIFENNFCRGMLPWRLQLHWRSIVNGVGEILFSMQLWVMLFFVSTCALWFFMAVVIYPEQMLAALACVAGMAFVLFTVVSGHETTKAHILEMFKAELPEILDLVCDNFLAQYEKTQSASMMRDHGDRLRNESLVWQQIAKYQRVRLSKFGWNQESYQKLYADEGDASLVHKAFSRALLKKQYWDRLAKAEKIVWKKANKAAIAKVDDMQGEAFQDMAASKGGVKDTKQMLEGLGLRHDEMKRVHLDLRVQITDRETDAGGEMVHLYNKSLREKLMQVFVRILQDSNTTSPDVMEALQDPKRLAKAIYRAHQSKLKLLDPQALTATTEVEEGERVQTLLQLFIQEVHTQKMKKLYYFIADHLDSVLDPGYISEKATGFLDKRIPDEIAKHLRLTLDEHCVGSAMQLLFETLRRWKGSIPEGELRKSLTLQPVNEKDGLMKTMEIVGLLNPNASLSYRQAFWRKLDRKVRQWKVEESSEAAVEADDLEEFVRELVEGMVWWDALRILLRKMGFPMAGLAEAGLGVIPERLVMREFEGSAMREGFLPVTVVLEFLRQITRAEGADGLAGRMWKSQAVFLMQTLGICGFVRARPAGGTVGRKSMAGRLIGQDEADDDAIQFTDAKVGFEVLQDLAGITWPAWVEEIWNKTCPEWSPRTEGEDHEFNMPMFLPKGRLQLFLRQVAFPPHREKHDLKPKALNLTEIDEVYDNWFKSEAPATVWTKRSRTMLQLRGIWHEMFLTILERMENPLMELEDGVKLFEEALDLQEAARAENPDVFGMEFDISEGLLDVAYLEEVWLRRNLVEHTEDCSLQVFREVLQRAEITLPQVVADAIWMAADREGCLHPSLRKVNDLEDRVVLYLSKGLCYESARALVRDELQVPTLQALDEEAVKAAFNQVDEKTGMVGFIEPREVNEMILLLGQNGMTQPVLDQAFKRLKMNLPEETVKAAFLMMDTNSDDVIDMAEFLGMIDYFIGKLIPQQVFDVMDMNVQQVAKKLILTLVTLSTVCLFLVISLTAFQVEVTKSAGNGAAGASFLRAGLAVAAAIGLRRDATSDDQDTRFQQARENLYRLMGVTQSELETRRRATTTETTVDTKTHTQTAKTQQRGGARMGSSARGGSHGQDHHHDDHDHHHDDDDD